MADGGERDWHPRRARYHPDEKVVLVPRSKPPAAPEALDRPRRRWRKLPPPLLGYGLYDQSSGLWLTVGSDGGLRFDAVEPAPLNRYFTEGGERFAFALLKRVQEWSQTGEVVDGHWADCTTTQAQAALVAAIPAPRRQDLVPPRRLPCALEDADRPTWDFLDFSGADLVTLSHTLRQDDQVRFDIHGPAAMVERFLAGYLAAYPVARFGTRTVIQEAAEGDKSVRVMRRKTPADGADTESW